MKYSQEYQDQIIQEYKNGMFVNEIAEKYKHSPKTIRKIFRANNFSVEKRWRRNDELDVDYFKTIDSPIKAYFLGFLFADGFILKDGYATGINLNSKDRQILERFSEEIYKTKDRVYDIPARGSSDSQSRLIIKSEQFQKNLIDKNLKFRKSLILEPPFNLPENLERYFILGYFDGDGCANRGHFGVTSTKMMCEWIIYVFEKNKLITNYSLHPAKNKITHRLKIFRKKDLPLVYDFLYKDHLICLDRKRQKIWDHINNGYGPKVK